MKSPDSAKKSKPIMTSSEFSDRLNSVSNMITIINKSIQQTYQEKKTWRTPKPYYGVVNIGLVDGKDLKAKQDNSLPNPFVRLKLGNEKGRSKSKPKTLNPYWCEQFDFYLYDDQTNNLELSVKSDEIGKEVPMGECSIDLKAYPYETTHHLQLPLNDDNGILTVLITISLVDEKAISMRRVQQPQPQPQQLQQTPQQQQISDNSAMSSIKVAPFAYWKTFFNLSRIGWLQVTITKAYGLAPIDLVGTCDPYCIIELENNRIQTQTIHKTVNPEWFKTLDMYISDIHSILKISVYSDNANKKSILLGKIAIPILRIRRGENAYYQLKDEYLREKKKGILVINADYAYNPIRAAYKTFKPKDKILMKPEPKLRVSVMRTNIDRAKKMIKKVIDTKKEIESMISWKYKMKSISILLIFIVTVLYIQLYMVPIILLFLLLRNLFVANIRDNTKDIEDDQLAPDEDDDFETKVRQHSQQSDISSFDEKKDSEEKKSFLEKFQAIQDVCLTVQEVLNKYVSLFERICNLFNWRNPWITSLFFIITILSSFVLYIIPIRMIILALGIKRFIIKFLFPNYKTNNEVLDMLSRVHCDKELAQFQEIPIDPSLLNEVSKLKIM